MHEPSEPFVSVVTPVHNTGEYLAQCIDSVLCQTHKHFEYIIVNNLSTDNSLAIAEHYASLDPRIRVVNTTQLLSQAANYNYALRQLSPASKYCKMVQADDFLFPRCVADLIAVAEAHPSVGLVSSYYLYGAQVKNVGLPYDSSAFPGKAICRRQLLDGSFFFGS